MELKFAWLALALALAGCAGSSSADRVLQAYGNVRVDAASPGLPYDYVVSINNVKDIGYDPDNPETRNSTALRFMSAQCPSARVVGETVMTTGSYPLGGAARTYAVQVKCKA
ncbi:hypothetical protein [Bradyrhizobium embrapense]|uniref:hypothetical protein n=1 Tax=Bradyrhizobium embrapense TaxID=630921 RepID=UPI00067D6977|nr:hypothetical protein [Bradyrhizobium embrapense]